MNDNYDLVYERNALLKRRGDLLEEIAGCSGAIAKIDSELQAEHAFDGVDPDDPI